MPSIEQHAVDKALSPNIGPTKRFPVGDAVRCGYGEKGERRIALAGRDSHGCCAQGPGSLLHCGRWGFLLKFLVRGPIHHVKVSFPQLRGHLVKPHRPSLQTRLGSRSRELSDGASGIKHLDVFEDIQRCLFTNRVTPMIRDLALECPEEASTQAFSQQLPVRLILGAMPWVVSRCWYRVSAYWLSRSERCRRPA